MENLTTPELKEFDASLPGENWFFYWKTSSSLWEAKLKEYHGGAPILVPIFWSLHCEYNGHYDFGQHKPETNLKRLCDIAVEVGHAIIFLVPLTPAPFLTNGGIPAFLARNLSENQEGVGVTAIDATNMVNKVYSFYDPKIFQAFRKFVYQLGQYFSHSGIDAPVMGLDSFRLEGGHLVSYFKDYSKSFREGFGRYVKQIQDSEPEKIQRLSEDAEFAKELKHEYSLLISSLYEEAARGTLAGNWRGKLQSSFIGGSSEDLFRRSFEQWDNEKDYFEALMKSIVYGQYPSSVLLGSKIKSKALGKALRDSVNPSLLKKIMQDDFYSDDSSLGYSPLVFFELSDNGEGHFSFERAMDQSGLGHFFETEYPWSYHISQEFEFDYDDIESRKVFFFFGERLDVDGLNQVLKLFMNGQKVFLDVWSMSEAVAKKLEYFLIENMIKTEKLNYLTPVLKAALGEGLIITYNRFNLKQNSLIKRKSFWQTMIAYLDVRHMQVDADTDIQYFWTKRAANSFELNYQEVRRVHAYNPTSYKKKIRFKATSGFAFIRSVDERFVEVKSTPIGIELMMLPGGSITLDFGYFEP